MYTISEKAAISRAFALSAEEHFVNSRTMLVRARVIMIASRILREAAQEIKRFAELMRTP